MLGSVFNHAAFKHIGRANKVCGETRFGIFVNFSRRANLHELAGIHYGDTRSQGHRFFLIVRNDNKRNT